MVKQHRGAIKLAVRYRSMLLFLLPHFAATHFHMQEDTSPGYDKKQEANETKRLQTERSRE